MSKDRDQLTPAEPDPPEKLRPRRSAAREVEQLLDRSTGKGSASSGADPKASDELDDTESSHYR
jgi:hypothetical protein